MDCGPHSRPGEAAASKHELPCPGASAPLRRTAPGTIRTWASASAGPANRGGSRLPREPPTSGPMRPARFERAYCACVVRGGAQLMTWFPERIERVCRQPPERCRDLAWLHRGLSTVSGTASRRSWRQRLDRRSADERPSGGSTSIGMLLAGFGLALRHRDQRWRSLRCPPTRGRQALPPSWR